MTRQVLAADGIRGLYRGFGIVVVGIIPARGVRHSAISSPCQRGRPGRLVAVVSRGCRHDTSRSDQQSLALLTACCEQSLCLSAPHYYQQPGYDLSSRNSSTLSLADDAFGRAWDLLLRRCTSRLWSPRRHGAWARQRWPGGRQMRLPGPAWRTPLRGRSPPWSRRQSSSPSMSSASASWLPVGHGRSSHMACARQRAVCGLLIGAHIGS